MESETRQNVFEYITEEETNFQSGNGVPVVGDWEFKMYDHIKKSVLFKYGQLETGDKDNKPVENIILPILNVAYRLEDINVKDVEAYVNKASDYHKSLLVRKFHDKWAREFELDTFFDEAKTEWIDFGLGLVKNNGKSPEVVPLQRLAFCDQTDILSGPICEKHMYSPDQLLEMSGKWDDEAIDEAITMSRAEKANTQIQGKKAKTPGQYIEVYELHGMFPEDWLKDNGDMDKYTRQLHVITYYQGEDIEKKGITLFKGPESKLIYDAVKRSSSGKDPFGRACGYGGVEELLEPQVWHTYANIQLKEMLDQASQMIVATTDAALAKRTNLNDLVKGEILEVASGEEVKQLVITPINWQVFDNWQAKNKLAAQTTGSANDPQLGVEPKSGTAMGLQELTVAQGQGIHEYRRGLFSTFMARLYKNWFLKFMVNKMKSGDEWLQELDLKELQWVADKMSKKQSEDKKIELILNGEEPNQADIDDYRESIKEQIFGEGNKQWLTILKDEFKDIPIDVHINIAGKQKDLANMTEKIVSFMRSIIQSPQILQIPGMADLMNQVVEYSGLNPVDFSSLKAEQLVAPQQQQQLTQPSQELAVQ